MAEPLGIIMFGKLEQARIVFPNLFTPKKFKRNGKESGEAKYSALFMFPKDHPDLAAIKTRAVEVAKAKWPGVDTKSLKFPFSDGNAQKAKAEADSKDGAFYEDMILLKTSSKFEPVVLDARNDPLSETIDQKLVYSGCYVAAEVNFVAYDRTQADGKDGVTCYLNIVCYVRKGERIAGRNAAEAFRGIRGQASNEDPTGGALGLDDEIPF
jgi:hypothetical protein